MEDWLRRFHFERSTENKRCFPSADENRRVRIERHWHNDRPSSYSPKSPFSKFNDSLFPFCSIKSALLPISSPWTRRQSSQVVVPEKTKARLLSTHIKRDSSSGKKTKKEGCSLFRKHEPVVRKSMLAVMRTSVLREGNRRTKEVNEKTNDSPDAAHLTISYVNVYPHCIFLSRRSNSRLQFAVISISEFPTWFLVTCRIRHMKCLPSFARNCRIYSPMENRGAIRISFVLQWNTNLEMWSSLPRFLLPRSRVRNILWYITLIRFLSRRKTRDRDSHCGMSLLVTLRLPCHSFFRPIDKRHVSRERQKKKAHSTGQRIKAAPRRWMLLSGCSREIQRRKPIANGIPFVYFRKCLT